MTTIDLEIRDGPRSRLVPAVALAAMLKVSSRALHAALFALLDPQRTASPQVDTATAGSGERGVGGNGDRFESTEPEIPSESNRSDRSDGSIGSLGQYLASALGDHANLGAMETIARKYHRDVIEEALRRTLEVPPERIRTNRAAYFTTVLRNLSREPSGRDTDIPYGA